MAETFPYIGSIDVVHKNQDPKVDQMLIRSFGLNTTLARAYLGASITGRASGSEVQVTLDTETSPGFDIGSNFASNKYTAPVAGYYQVDWCIYLQGDGGTLTAGLSYLNKNATTSAGAIAFGSYDGASGNQYISTGGGLHYLALNDYLTISAYATATGGAATWKILTSTINFMSVYLVAKA